MTADVELPPLVPPAPQGDPELPADPDQWLADRLTDDPDLFERLGLTGQDLTDTHRAVDSLLADDSPAGAADRAQVVDRAARIRRVVGRFVTHADVFGDRDVEARVTAGIPGHGWGVLGLCALVATVPEVLAFHRSRGVPDARSWEVLADLGRQARMHRELYDEFGMRADAWELRIWCGSLYRFGRLQYNLKWYEPLDATPGHPVADPTPRWVLATHIPGIGPLTPELVDDSLEQCRAFFAEHFSDFPVKEFTCTSWLLDPRMTRLSPESNLVKFHARWQLDGPGTDANKDAYYFLWSRRGEVDPATLPTDTSLQRLVAGEILAGRPWQLCRGLIRH